jgi:hypothetical protein
MDLQDRLKKCELDFDLKKQEYEQHTKAADECNTEMIRLQGEYRVLQSLLDNEPKTSKQATVIEAEPEKAGV